jgi:hypothetical protein
MARPKPRPIADAEAWGLEGLQRATAWTLAAPAIVILRLAAAPGGAEVGSSPWVRRLQDLGFIEADTAGQGPRLSADHRGRPESRMLSFAWR